MQTTAIRTVANSLPEKGVILLTLLISDRYILFAELRNILEKAFSRGVKIEFFHKLEVRAPLRERQENLLIRKQNRSFFCCNIESLNHIGTDAFTLSQLVKWLRHLYRTWELMPILPS